MTDTMTSQNIDRSSWGILYITEMLEQSLTSRMRLSEVWLLFISNYVLIKIKKFYACLKLNLRYKFILQLLIIL
jgi:hypothetical protein